MWPPRTIAAMARARRHWTSAFVTRNQRLLPSSYTTSVTFPNETQDYRSARSTLLQREVALRREMEAVAAELRAPVSVFGSLSTRIALPFTAILMLDASAFEMSSPILTDLVPSCVVGQLVRVWVERLRRLPLMISDCRCS